MVFHVTPFWLHLCYFLVVSLVGYLALRVLKPRADHRPNDFDLFFTSVSTTTVSSMSTVEMEVFSNDQLIVMTILMFLGGEVYTSILFFQLQRLKISYSSQKYKGTDNSPRVLDSIYNSTNQTPATQLDQIIELGTITHRDRPLSNKFFNSDDEGDLRYKSIKVIGYVVLGYLLVTHVVGSSLILWYISVIPSANNVLKGKGIIMLTFSIFTTISTFTNCGFVPTNENMNVFRKNSGLLLILIPQILLGNTLYLPCLRLVIYVLERFTKKKEYTYMLTKYQELGYGHLKSSKESWFQAATVLVLLLLQFLLFALMEWSSGVMEGMNSYQKLVGSIFQTTNSRHTGESIVDLSTISSAILVLFVVMMYLPPCTSFIPIGNQRQEASEDKNNYKERSKNNILVENMIFSQLSYLAIFVIVICITERKHLKEDPLNFNVLNIVLEVTSAYGNVGFSTGYSCKRRLKMDENCVDKWYGFAGRWSKGGKFALILVMFMGRFKALNMHGGKAWKLA